MGFADGRFRFICDFRTFLIAIAGLAVAYVPFGLVGTRWAFLYALDLVIHEPHVPSKLWSLWLLVALLVASLQILFCLLSAGEPHPVFQNPALKVVALLGQLSWGIYGHDHLFWYLWLGSSCLLFWVTPRTAFEDRLRASKRHPCILPTSLLEKLRSR